MTVSLSSKAIFAPQGYFLLATSSKSKIPGIAELGAALFILALSKFIIIDCGRVCGVIGDHGSTIFGKTVEFIDEAKMLAREGRNALGKIVYATTTASNAWVDLSKKTGQVLVKIQHAHTGALQGIRGDAQLVAEAIKKGIEEKKFKPDAKADVHIGKVSFQENNALLNACLTM